MIAIPWAHVPSRLSVGAVRLRRALQLVLALALVAGCLLSPLLPASAGWENSWLENAQVVVLLAGGGMALQLARRSARWGSARALVALGAALVPVWSLLVAREVSWGATFLAPLAMTADGPVFSSSVLWYKPAVYPLAGLAVVFTVALFARYRLDRLLWRLARDTPFVWPEVALVLCAAVLSTYAEGHLLGLPVAHALAGHEVVMEEWMELVGYLALVVGQWHVFTLLRSGVAAFGRR